MTSNPHKPAYTAQAAAGSVPPTNTAGPAANLISSTLPAVDGPETVPLSPPGGTVSPDLVERIELLLASTIQADFEEGQVVFLSGFREAAAAAIQAVTEAQWRPIETATKDETVLVSVSPTPTNDAFFRVTPAITHPAYIDANGNICDAGTWRPDGGLNGPYWKSTHWMPLPPPKSEESEHG